MNEEGISGCVTRDKDGKYSGWIKVDGVDLSPISAMPFKDGDDVFVWLKRKEIMEYDIQTSSYKTRKREPQWECYLKKENNNNNIVYKGEFVFLKFKYRITAMWDLSFGDVDQQTLNLFVERLPKSEQTILQGINERKRKYDK